MHIHSTLTTYRSRRVDSINLMPCASLQDLTPLPPTDFPCLDAVAERLVQFERYYGSIAQPFEWKFTRANLNALIARMRARYRQCQPLKLTARTIHA